MIKNIRKNKNKRRRIVLNMIIYNKLDNKNNVRGNKQ